MKKLLMAILLLCASQLFSQSYPFKFTGNIQYEKEKTPIESATVHIERVKDNSVISYTISDEKGNFSLAGKTFYKDVKLVVSFLGMQNYEKVIPFNKLSNYSTGMINLKEENLLDEVVIKSRAPITVKKDTLEFNVKSFKTKKDANVEDLLKKLPGVEIDDDGKITVNGKPVNKILVNGKPFFGNDPSITTKNLTKEIIEKVQITDTKSKSESFTGEKGDANNKTINLTIKKENNKGWFGRISASVGTDKRNEAATMINHFDNNQRFSVLASTNNINSPGFSFGEIQKMFGGGDNMWVSDDGSFSINGLHFGGGRGIIKSRTGGATYADEYGKGFDVNANYFYSGSSSNNLSKRNREYTITNRRYFTNSSSKSDDENDNHSIDLDFDIEIDSTFLVNISPNFVFNKRKGFFNQSEISLNSDRTLTNSYTSSSNSEATAKNFRNTLDITKKLDTIGSFIKAHIENQIDKSNTDEYNNSTIKSFDSNPSEEIRNQFNDVSTNVNNFITKITYRHPLIAKKLFLDVAYTYENKEQESSNNVFDFNDTQQQYNNFNTDLSSNFTFTDISKVPSLSLNYKTKKWSFGFGTAYIDKTLKNDDKLRPNLSLSKRFDAITFNSRFNYRFKSKASLYFNYNLDLNTPNLNQVQPFTNVTNPSNIIRGNKNLKPTKEHRIYAGYNKYNWQKSTGFRLYLGGRYYNNQVVSNTTIDNNLIRQTTYTNADGEYNFWGGGRYNFGVKLDSISSIKIKIGTWVSGNRSINILNNVINKANTISVTPNIGLTYDYNKIINIEPRYEIRFSNTKYSANSFQNQNFTRHSLRIHTRTNIPKKLEWINDVRYTFNPNLEDFNRAAWFWNSTLSYSIFKDKASITLKAYDLLNQNTNAERRSRTNYVEDSESTVLQRYFMLGFSWKFNSLGKKGEVRDFRFMY